MALVAAVMLPLQALAQYGFTPPPDMGLVQAVPRGPALFGQRITELILACAIGFAVGAFFSPMLKPVRRFVWLGVIGLILLVSVFGPYPAADVLGWAVKAVVFFAALAIGLKLGQMAAAQQARDRPTSFGSAKWATYDYLKEHGLFGTAGFLLGEFAEGNRRTALRYEGARHLLTVAPTRSGKGVSSIIPNLLLHDGSALVVDPKGENALITAPRRGRGDDRRGIAGMGQDVFLLDPWDIAASKLDMKPSRFNPLDWIQDGDPDATENAFLLAEALVIKEGGESAFWDEEAKALLTGLILHVAKAKQEKGSRHLGRVRELLTLDEETFSETLRLMADNDDPVIRSTGARTMGKEARLRSSVIASAQSHTHFLESPRIRESLSATDFKFEDLKTRRQTVYLILPADRLVTFNRYLRLLIQQAITVNARNIGEKPTRPILFMLDEMPTLGRLPSIEQAYGLMAGFGMQLWGIVQDLSQLAHTYGTEGYQTFIANSGVIQYMGSRDKMTSDYFSSLCGVTTIELHNFSWAISKAMSIASSYSPGGSSTSSTESDSWTRTHGVSESQRQLAYPDELMVLRGNQQLVFVENLDPIPAQKVTWYQDAKLRALGVNLHQPVSEARPTRIESAPSPGRYPLPSQPAIAS